MSEKKHIEDFACIEMKLGQAMASSPAEKMKIKPKYTFGELEIFRQALEASGHFRPGSVKVHRAEGRELVYSATLPGSTQPATITCSIDIDTKSDS